MQLLDRWHEIGDYLEDLRSSTRSEEEREAAFSAYCSRFVERPGSWSSFILRHPLLSLGALVDLSRLSRLTADLDDSLEGLAIREGLSRSVRGRVVLHEATAVLGIPLDAKAYTAGASKQTLRRKIRAAEKLDVAWRTVTDPAERRELLQLAREQERNHPQDVYRVNNPTNDDLLDYRLWLLAESAQGSPLLLCVVPFEGRWALLRYFRTLGVGVEYTEARYLLTKVLVDALAVRGVQYLADNKSPFQLSNGLRHFQRTLGYRVVRVKLAPASARLPTIRPESRSTDQRDQWPARLTAGHSR